MAETAPATALDVHEIPFADLSLLHSQEPPADDERRRRLLATVRAALGRCGTGLLAVAAVPRAAALRRRLLPLARRLALMDHPSRAHLLKKHGLGSDVPLKKLDRSVSSFAQLLRYDSDKFDSPQPTSEATEHGCCQEDAPWPDESREYKGHGDVDDDIENLGELFRELGSCMMELGILVARACDIVVGGNQLEQSITDFGSAKARLIHYHSDFDNSIIRERSINRRKSVNNAAPTPVSDCAGAPHHRRPGSSHGSCIRSEDGAEDVAIQGQSSTISLLNLWQEWHYDYGILTVLTAPLFMCSALRQEFPVVSEECLPPDGHTHLQLFNKKRVFSVRCSSESFIVQVGEAADILSGGRLRSTLHAVSRPLGSTNISREAFVVFLQPSWHKTLPCLSSYSSADDEDDVSDHTGPSLSSSDGSAGESCSKEDTLMQEILKKIPPLSSRLKEGMTFADFSRQTTKQYYGGGGIQKNN